MPATVDVGSIVSRFQIRNLEDQLAKLQEIETTIANLEGKQIQLGMAGGTGAGAQRVPSWIEDTATQVEKIRTGLGQLRDGARTFASGITTPFRDTFNVFSGISGTILTIGDRLTNIGQRFAAFAFRAQLLLTPLQVAAGNLVRDVFDLEKQLAVLGTQTDLTGTDLEAWGEETQRVMQDTSETWAVSQEELTETLFHLISSMDLAPEVANRLLDVIAKYGVVGDTTTGSIAELSTILLSTFSDPAILRDPERGAEAVAELDKMLAQTFLSMKEGRGTFGEYVAQIGDFARIGETVGATSAELLALFAILTRTRPISEAATQIKRISQSLIEENTIGALNALGISVEGIDEAFGGLDLEGVIQSQFGPIAAGMEGISSETEAIQRAPFDVLIDFFEALDELPEPERLRAFEEVFPNIRAELGALEFGATREDVMRLADELDPASQAFADGMQTINEHAQEVNTTVPSLVERLASTLVNFAQDIESDFHERIEGAFTALIEGLQGLRENLDPETRAALAEFVVVLSAIPPVMLALSTAVLGAGAVVSTAGTLISPGVAGPGLAAWLLFRQELEAFADVLADYDLETLDGLLSFFAEVGVALGQIDVEQAQGFLDALGVVDDIDSERVTALESAIGGITDKVTAGVEYVQMWTSAFDDFLEMVQNREGAVGTFVGYMERLAGFLSGAAEGKINVDVSTEEARANVIDKVIGTAIGLSIARALQGVVMGVAQITTGFITVLGGINGLRLPGLPGGGGAAGIPGQGGTGVPTTGTGRIPGFSGKGAALIPLAEQLLATGAGQIIPPLIVKGMMEGTEEYETMLERSRDTNQAQYRNLLRSFNEEIMTAQEEVAGPFGVLPPRMAPAAAPEFKRLSDEFLAQGTSNERRNELLEDMVRVTASLAGMTPEEVSERITPAEQVSALSRMSAGLSGAIQGLSDFVTGGAAGREESFRQLYEDEAARADEVMLRYARTGRTPMRTPVRAMEDVGFGAATVPITEDRTNAIETLASAVSRGMEMFQERRLARADVAMAPIPIPQQATPTQLQGLGRLLNLPAQMQTATTEMRETTDVMRQTGASGFGGVGGGGGSGFGPAEIQGAADNFNEKVVKPLDRIVAGLERVTTGLDGVLNRLSTLVPVPSTPQVNRAETRGLIRHGGGYGGAFLLPNEFVTSPLTTRMLEGVVGGPLTQRSLRNLAVQQAAINQVSHTISVTGQMGIDVAGTGGMGGIELTPRQREELQFEITEFAVRKIREQFAAA